MKLENRQCPLCKIAFLRIPMGDQDIEVCESCHGTFFEFDEMAAVLSVPSWEIFKAIAYGDGRADRQGSIGCPKCGAEMSEKEYALSKIHIDRCESCMSVFLDSGEHDAINRYLTSLDSPDVAAAEEEAFENDYRKKLVEMAMKFKTEILDRQDYT